MKKLICFVIVGLLMAPAVWASAYDAVDEAVRAFKVEIQPNVNKPDERYEEPSGVLVGKSCNARGCESTVWVTQGYTKVDPTAPPGSFTETKFFSAKVLVTNQRFVRSEVFLFVAYETDEIIQEIKKQ